MQTLRKSKWSYLMESSQGFFIFLFQIISYYNEPLLALLSIYINTKKILCYDQRKFALFK